MGKLTPFFMLSLSLLLFSGGAYLFKETLAHALIYEEAIRQNTIDTTTLRIGGITPKCSVDVALSSWPDLNQLAIYRWVIACEEARHD